MARVPYPDATALSPETQDQLAKLPPLNLFRMMAGGEGLLRGFVQLGNYLLRTSALSPVLRELAILRVGALSKARYEVFHHERIARDLGMSDALIEAARRGAEDPALDELQRMVMRFTDDVVHNIRASDETLQPLVARLPLREVQELTVTIGYYMTACRFLETFDIDIEGDAAAPR
jgi:4-carboxymuconolactone decarboxylase